MIIKTDKSQRSVLLALNFEGSNNSLPSVERVANIRVTSISACFSDIRDVVVERFAGNDEAALLRRFWRSIRPTDRIFAKNVVKDFEILRRRSWILDVIPALGIDLRSIYNVQLWDVSLMWTEGYVPGPLFITQPAQELDVPFIPGSYEVTVHCRD